MGVDQLVGAEGAAAFLALVSVGPLIAALGAGSHNIAVSQKLLCLLVVVLLTLLFDELAVLIELTEELRGRLVMGLGRGSGIDVETDTELSEGLLYQLMVFVHDILGRAALLAGLNGDGHPVLIRAAHEKHVPAAHSQIPDVDVSGNVDSRQVSDVNRSVGIRQSGRNKITLKFLHILSVFLKNVLS